MKKIYAICLCSVVLTLYGCDFLNTIPKDQASPGTFLSNETQAQSLMTGIYSTFIDESPSYMKPYTTENMCDNSYNHHTWEFSDEFARGSQTSSSWLAELKWTRCYQGISRANFLIGGLKGTGISPESQVRMTAEARALRAMFYFDLLRFYGRVPIVDENSPLENSARQSKKAVMDFILADIEYADKHLDVVFGGERVSRASNMMLKMQLAQYMEDHEEVIACAKAIEKMGYELYPDYGKLFMQSGFKDAANKETIFKLNYAKDKIVSYVGLVTYSWFSFNITLSAANSYFTINGLPVKPIVAEDGSVLSPDPLFDSENPSANRDPRMKTTVLCPGDEFSIAAYDRYQKHWTPASWDCMTGMALKKFYDPSVENLENDGTDKMIMRFGEVLLAWAESENELNGPAGAYPIIDRLRKRAKMPALSTTLPNVSKDMMRELIRNERRVELMGEGQRWHDIRRWRIAELVMTNATGYNVNKLKYYPEGGGVSPDWQFEEVVVEMRSFNKNRDYLWPIPFKEINANPLIKNDQNPGY